MYDWNGMWKIYEIFVSLVMEVVSDVYEYIR